MAGTLGTCFLVTHCLTKGTDPENYVLELCKYHRLLTRLDGDDLLCDVIGGNCITDVIPVDRTVIIEYIAAGVS